MTVIKCQKCGNESNEEAKFCCYCGNALSCGTTQEYYSEKSDSDGDNNHQINVEYKSIYNHIFNINLGNIVFYILLMMAFILAVKCTLLIKIPGVNGVLGVNNSDVSAWVIVIECCLNTAKCLFIFCLISIIPQYIHGIFSNIQKEKVINMVLGSFSEGALSYMKELIECSNCPAVKNVIYNESECTLIINFKKASYVIRWELLNYEVKCIKHESINDIYYAMLCLAKEIENKNLDNKISSTKFVDYDEESIIKREKVCLIIKKVLLRFRSISLELILVCGLICLIMKSLIDKVSSTSYDGSRTSYARVFDYYFDKGMWTTYLTRDNELFVQFDGEMDAYGEKIPVTVKYKVDWAEEQYEITDMIIDDYELSSILINTALAYIYYQYDINNKNPEPIDIHEINYNDYSTDTNTDKQSEKNTEIATQRYTNLTERVIESYIGSWGDFVSERCMLDIFYYDEWDEYVAHIHWGSSYDRTTEWVFILEYDNSNDALVYSDGICAEVYYDDFGNSTTTTIYDNGTGAFYIDGEYLYWVDEIENAGEKCIFERISSYGE